MKEEYYQISEVSRITGISKVPLQFVARIDKGILYGHINISYLYSILAITAPLGLLVY